MLTDEAKRRIEEEEAYRITVRQKLEPKSVWNPERAGPQRVIVTDVQWPFFSLVWFLVKLSVAAIPAAIIFTLLWFVIVTVLTFIGASFPRFIL